VRIAIVNQHPRDVTGGSELQCDLLARGLTQRGHAVRFIVVSPAGAPQSSLHDLPYATTRVGAGSDAIVAACRDHDADVVYWRMNRPGLGAVVRGLARFPIPLVFAPAHADDVSRWPVRDLPTGLGPRGLAVELRTRLRERIEWRALQRVAGLAAQREDFLGRVSVPSQRLVRNVLDPALIDAGGEGAWSWPRPYVAWVGNIKHRKRPEELLPLVGPLREEGVDLLVIGAVAEDRYSGLFAPDRVGDGVHALGPLPLGDVLEVVAGARALVVTAREEGFSNVLIQSWWYGTPVVSLGYDPDGLIVQHGLGVVCGEDREVFRSAVATAARGVDPAKRAAIAAFARETFALDPNLDALEDLLDAVVKSAR
jgi:glycosyltransferase involved in cell wall biosynthesis